MFGSSGYDKSADLYDLFDNKKNIEFFKEYSKEVDKVLDVGAGTGRIAIPIAEEGKEVYCIEPSRAMLDQFKVKIDEKTDLYPKLNLIEDNAKNFSIDDEFSLIIMSGVFDHLIKDECRICTLLNLNKHLVNGGNLVFDVGLGYMEENNSFRLVDSIKKEEKEYKRFIKREKLGENKLSLTLKYEIYEQDELINTVEQISEIGIIDKDKLHKLLKETGFKVKKEFGDYKFKPYQERDSVCVIEAVKKE